MSRRRKTALEVPASTEEATALLAAYVEVERVVLLVRIRDQLAMDAMKAERDAELALLGEAQEQRFASLKAWWEAAGQELAKGRSAELAGAKIGIRLAPPKVKFAKGTKAEGVVEWLLRLRWARAKEFLRRKVELDKQALIKAHAGDEYVRRMFARAGVGVVQEDEFFIDTGLDEDAIRASIEAPE